MFCIFSYIFFSHYSLCILPLPPFLGFGLPCGLDAFVAVGAVLLEHLKGGNLFAVINLAPCAEISTKRTSSVDGFICIVFPWRNNVTPRAFCLDFSTIYTCIKFRTVTNDYNHHHRDAHNGKISQLDIRLSGCTSLRPCSLQILCRILCQDHCSTTPQDSGVGLKCFLIWDVSTLVGSEATSLIRRCPYCFLLLWLDAVHCPWLL